MSALTTRDALANALCKGTSDRQCINYDSEVAGGCSWCDRDADALLASGVVVDAATLADDDALLDAWSVEYARRNRPYDHPFYEVFAAHALAAALSERSSR